MKKKKNKIKKILLCFFIIWISIASVLVAWKYYRDTRLFQKKYSQDLESWNQSRMTIEEIKSGLSEEEIMEAYDRVYCWKLLAEGTEYLDNSIFIRINPYEKNVGMIYLDFSNGEGRSFNEVKSYLLQDETICDIKFLANIEIDNKYIVELIEVYDSSNGIKISVCADSMDLCEKLANAIQVVINDKYKNSACQIEYRTEVDQDMVGLYQTIADQTRLYEEKAIEYELNMSDEALVLFEAVWRENFCGNDILTQEVEEPVLEKAHVDMKTVGISIVSGMLCATAIILIYFMIQSINNEEREQK